MKYAIIMALICLFVGQVSAQKQKTENIIIITFDGLRWQEVFGGADDSLISNTTYVVDTGALRNNFWAADKEERRKLLMPFLWNTVAKQGQLYGNRWEGSHVNNANQYWFSYPGYNELFTGYPDDSVNSNDKRWNKNVSVLEFINKQPGYRNKVAAFATWDVFPYILNERRSGIYVNAGLDSLQFNNPQLQLLNDMQFMSAKLKGGRSDVVTYYAAREYLKAYKPKVLYIAFDDTDGHAHSGKYDQYLISAKAEDAMIAEIWDLVQQMPEYKNKTTLIITCDHGRGDAIKSEWRHHGKDVKDAGQIWMAVMGPDTKPAGEIKGGSELYQAQLAATMAELLGMKYKPSHFVAPPVKAVLR